jgi:hypothetical protein
MSKCSRVCGITDFVGGDDEQHEVDASDAGQHRAHETFVAGHVHERRHHVVGDRRMREAELDGDAARLLLLEAVGSVPVSARTSALLPWSMCPAVPTTRLGAEASDIARSRDVSSA